MLHDLMRKPGWGAEVMTFVCADLGHQVGLWPLRNKDLASSEVKIFWQGCNIKKYFKKTTANHFMKPSPIIFIFFTIAHVHLTLRFSKWTIYIYWVWQQSTKEYTKTNYSMVSRQIITGNDHDILLFILCCFWVFHLFLNCPDKMWKSIVWTI